MYYFTLVRFHISNQIHIRNRRNLDKSWKEVLERRRRLRVLESNYLKPMNNNLFLDK